VRLAKNLFQSSGISNLISSSGSPPGGGDAPCRAEWLNRLSDIAFCPGSERNQSTKSRAAFGFGPSVTMPQLSGGRRQAGFRSCKCNRRPFLFPFEVAGILGCMDDLVLLIDQPVVLLNVGVKAFLGRGLINAQP
jgi:hypothetical protein